MSALLDHWAFRLDGIMHKSRGQVLCPGPDHSPGDQSLSVMPARSPALGFFTHSLAGDDMGACRDYVASRLGPDRARPTLQLPSRGPKRKQDVRERVGWLWRQRQPIVGGAPPWKYLREARAHAGLIPATLAYLPPRGEQGPAMIAPFGLATEPEAGKLAIADQAVKAVHLTRLLPDGSGRLGKIMVGKGALGSPICLAPPNDGLALAICEGVEDALSIHAALAIGAWAAGSAPFMPALAANVPRFVEVVHVFGHRDRGERFARDLFGRLDVLGFEVIVKVVEGRP